jgi:hypothetical protein
MASNWEAAAGTISSAIFKINTHSGSGTGFILTLNGPKENQVYGLVTAYHVIGAAHELEMPIRITHQQTGNSAVLKPDPLSRAIIAIPDKDLAFILFSKSLLNVDITPPQIVGQGVTKNAGLEIGWCGFPSVATNELCFFHGFISTPFHTGYLVDGVVIHGVSGGPAFYLQGRSPRICGVITQYLPNYATGQSLPGLGFISSVEPYQQTLSQLRSLDDAGKAADVQREANLSASPSPSPSPAPDAEDSA